VAICNTNAEDNGFFCKKEEGKYRICRRCPDIQKDKPCKDDISDCQCDNIEVYDEEQGKYIGGSSCEDGFCFVSKERALNACDDVDYYTYHDYTAQYVLEDSKDFYHPYDRDIVKSSDACENTDKISTGNEEILEWVRITKDYLNGVETIKETDENGNLVALKNGAETNLTAYATETGDYRDCIKICKSMCGKCGAWSFDESELKCYFHTVDACCGQTLKQEKDNNFLSGYFCNQCWSTKGACPCSLEERLKTYPTDCKGVNEFSNDDEGAKTPDLTSSAAKLIITENGKKADACENVRRKLRRRCFTLKPQCKDPITNPNGTCEDKQRCRPTPISSKWKPC